MATRTSVTRTTSGLRKPVSFPESAEFEADLKTSVFPKFGTGQISYSRASVATFTDCDGVIRDVLSGEARFEGARRVQNLHTYSEDISNAVWTAVSCTKQSNVTTAPDGTLTADRVQTNASTAFMEMYQNLDVVAGKTYTYSAYIKYHNWRYIQLFGNGLAFGLGYINIDIQTGTITSTTAGAGNFSGTITSVGNGWYRVSATATCIATLAAQHISISPINTGTDPRVSAGVGDGTSGYYIWGMQMEDVTYQSVKTPGEYVSTNVLSFPFHGACVDGVKYFDTYLDGTAIPDSILRGSIQEENRTNLITYSENFTTWTGSGSTTANAALAPDGTMNMDLWTPAAGTGFHQKNTLVTTTATAHCGYIYVKSNGIQFVQILIAGAVSIGYVNFDIINGVVGTQDIWNGSISAVRGFPGVFKITVRMGSIAAVAGAQFFVSAIDSLSSGRVSNATMNGTYGVYLWGAQLEAGAYQSTYMRTVGASITRAVDAISYSSLNVISNKGTAYCEFAFDDITIVDRRCLLFSGFTNSRLQLKGISSTANTPGVFIGTGASVPSIDSTVQNTTSSFTKFGANWNNTVSSKIYTSAGVVTNGTVPSLVLDRIEVGGAAGTKLGGYIRNIKVWKVPPTDAEMLALINN